MAVLIDPPGWPAHGRLWSHLISDVSLAELHTFARGLGVPARGFDGDHYDVPQDRYAAIVAAGAEPVSARDLLRRLQASGLRRPKRRGERVLASGPHGSGGHRLDCLSSTLPPPGLVTAVLLLVPGGDGGVLMVPGDGRPALPRATIGASQEPSLVAHGLLAELLAGYDQDGGPQPRQIGYLRFVPPDGSPAAVEVVLGVGAEAPDCARRPIPPAHWVEYEQVLDGLHPSLAALVRHAGPGPAHPRPAPQPH